MNFQGPSFSDVIAGHGRSSAVTAMVQRNGNNKGKKNSVPAIAARVRAFRFGKIVQPWARINRTSPRAEGARRGRFRSW
jgi:hypothetical protein